MAFENLGFETEDASALGLPDGWSVAVSSAGMLAAGYDDGSAAEAGNTPTEAFEGGHHSNEDFIFAYTYPFEVTELTEAVYDSAAGSEYEESYEDFEEFWDGNETYSYELGSYGYAQYDTTPETYEDFEEEWDSNESYSFTMGSTSVAQYDTTPENYEDFEEEWDDNDSYSYTMGSTSAAQYDEGTEAYEDFEEVLLPFNFVADPTTDIMTKTSHGLNNDDLIILSNEGGELPEGLNEGYEYYVISSTTNTFQLSVTLGGSAIDITSVGVGTHTLTPDINKYWTISMD